MRIQGASAKGLAACWLLLAGFLNAEELPEQDKEIVDWIASNYHVEIVRGGVTYPMQEPGYTISGTDAPAESISRYLPVLKRELSKYPRDLPSKVHLSKFVLAVGLGVDSQLRAAVPHFRLGWLLLDTERGRHSQEYQARVFHHEFFHLVDYADDGEVYQDPSWAMLNPAEFHYGRGGVEMQDPQEDPYAETDEFPGFLTRYGTAGVEEDKAEICSFLFTDSAFLEKRAAADSVVLAKLERMKSLLRAVDASLDDQFWEALKR